MFTGLVETCGELAARTPKGGGVARLFVRASGLDDDLALGDSVAVEGVCLTVDALAPGGFEADASPETLAKTTLGGLPLGALVNLERALRVGQRLGGHIVSGHVDGVGQVTAEERQGDAVKVTFTAPRELLRYVAEKGSITVNGVSLTVNGVQGAMFDVTLIPHTLRKTSLSAVRPGARVNLEVDVLARYVARLLEFGREDQTGADTNADWMARLTRAGFL
jgi:riboflavin synthase